MNPICHRPVIRKLGTLDCDMVEVTPIVIGGRLYRFEYVRENYWDNPTGHSFFHFKDVATGENTAPFAHDRHLGVAFHHAGVTYAYGVRGTWGAGEIDVFWSSDLVTWQQDTALTLPGWALFNTSVCEGPDGFVMAIEIGGPPEQCGAPFTMRFATSKDLIHWTMTPDECVYSKDRYTACPALRYVASDGFYYMIYLEAMPGNRYIPYIARSRDLIGWNRSAVNPVLMYDDFEDKKLANPMLPERLQSRIANALDINNSDIDLCEFHGRTIIYYSWGNQLGVEHLAEAVYEGSLEQFLQGWFTVPSPFDN